MATSRTLPDPSTEPTLKAPRAAAILGVSERHVYAAIERGEIPSVRLGKRIIIPTAEFLAKYRLVPSTPAA